MQLLERKEKLEKLNESYNRLQKKYGAKELDSICNGGKIDKPDICFVFMNPTGRNLSSNKSWKGRKSPWLCTKNIWKLFYETGLIGDDVYDEILSKKPKEWDYEFSDKVYQEVEEKNYFITNLGKCTQIDARPLSDEVLGSYLKLLLKQIHKLKTGRLDSSYLYELTKIVSEFEKSLNQAKDNFMSQFTEQKLSKLAGKIDGVYSSEVDMQFLQQNSDKLYDGELENLQNLVSQRDKLSKKIFKTKNIKSQIYNLNEQIKQEQSRIYEKIIGWYKSQGKNDILGINFDGFSKVKYKDSLKLAIEQIGYSQKAIEELKVEIQKAKEEIENKQKESAASKAKNIQQIKTLTGRELTEKDILNILGFNNSNTLDTFKKSFRRCL